MEIRTLGRRLLAREQACKPGMVSSDSVDRVYVDLVHNHLPRLADQDFITIDRETNFVAVDRDIPPYVSSIVSTITAYSNDQRHRILGTLAHPIRVSTVAILREEGPTLSLESLAELLAERVDAAVIDDEEAKIELHHWHLPALETIDLLTYDASSAEIVQLGEPYGTA